MMRTWWLAAALAVAVPAVASAQEAVTLKFPAPAKGDVQSCELKVETMNSDALSLAQTPTVDATGGSSRSLRRVTVRVQPTGASVDAASPTAEAVTYLTLGGP